MVPRLGSLIAFALMVGLSIGCGSESKPTSTSTVPSSNATGSSDAVDANFEAYLKDGTVIVETVPVQSFKMTVDRTSGSASSKQTEQKIHTKTSTVSFVKDTPDGKLFKIKTDTSIPSPAVPPGESYTLIANDGLYPASHDGKKQSPVPMVPAKLEVGKEWKGEQPPVTMTGTIVAKETIEVPAGKFEAYKIEFGMTGQPKKMELWFTPGKGIIKRSENELMQLTVGK